jgi:hypothetical protein
LIADVDASDPSPVNPFYDGPCRKAWGDATRNAKLKLSRLIAAYTASPVDSGQRPSKHERFFCARYDVWAEREVQFVLFDLWIPLFDKWLAAYAGKTLKQFQKTFPDAPVDALVTAFLGRHEHWKAEAYACVKRQEAYRAGLRASETAGCDHPVRPEARDDSSGADSQTIATTTPPNTVVQEANGHEHTAPNPIAEITAALDAGERKTAVDLRRKLEGGVTKTKLWSDAFSQRALAEQTKRTAFNRWVAGRRGAPSWADPLMRERLRRPVK